MADHSETESKITTDRKTIEQWAEDAGIVPVYRGSGDDPRNLALVRESQITDDHDTVSWDECFSTMEEHDMVVVAHSDEDLEILQQDEALSRASIEDQKLQQSLMDGEVVTSTITETTVIERTIVEEAEIESQVIDRETVEATTANAELLSRDIQDCNVTETDIDSGESVSDDQFEPGARLTDELAVEVTVDEAWNLTRDVLERLTIESRIVDTGSTETDTVEAEDINVEGIQQNILESDLVDTETNPSRVIESGTITTEFREGEVFETELLEEKTIEEELAVTKRYSGMIADGETVTVDTVSRELVHSDIVDSEGKSLEMSTAHEGEPMAETATETGTADDHYVPTQEDEGKTVVDATGEKVGMVVEVENETMFVEAHPSLADKIKTALDWGTPEEEAYPVTADQISSVSDDTVELEVRNT